MDGAVLEVSRFEDLLADDREDLSQEVLYVIVGEDLEDGSEVQLLQYLNHLVEDGQGFVLCGDGVHVSGRHLLPPLFF